MQTMKQQYHPVEDIIRKALGSLDSVCDGAIKKDGQGLRGGQAKTPFVLNMIARQEPYTANQLRAAYRTVNQYPRQLREKGITLPSWQQMEKLAKEKEQAQEQEKLAIQYGSRFTIKYHHEQFWVTFPFEDKAKWDKFFLKCKDSWYQNQPGFRIKPKWSEDEQLGWQLPRSYQMIDLLVQMLPKMQFIGDAVKAKQILDQEKHRARIKAMQEEASRMQAYNDLLNVLGNMEEEIVPGVKLYNHQIEAVQLACYKNRSIIADKMGVGKTLEGLVTAIAYAKKYNLKIIVITKKNIKRDWLRWASKLGVQIEAHTWQSIPRPSDLWEPYFLICDESHLSQNMKSQRTQKMLYIALHKQCRGLVHCTGTPTLNGRPSELYAMLYSCKHPLVWSDKEDPDEKEDEDKSLKKRFEERYCGAHLEERGGNKFWDISGSQNQIELHKMLYYKPKHENHPWSLMISRKKEECLDLPEKERQMYEAEVSAEGQHLIATMLVDAIEKFEENKETSLQEFKIEKAHKLQELEQIKREAGEPIEKSWQQLLDEAMKSKEEGIEGARTLALQTAYRHASALVKVDTTVDLAKSLLIQDEKVVIFTMFRDTALEFKRRLEEAGVKVGTVMGGQEEEATGKMVDDFQNPHGKIKVMVCTDAGGEGITLTAASYLILNDRAWTPGKNEQYEDRIHRIGTTNKCTIYWPQIPVEVCETDIKIDQILLEKDLNINMLVYGKASNHLTFKRASIELIKRDAKKLAKYLNKTTAVA